MKNLTLGKLNANNFTWLVIDDSINFLQDLTNNPEYTSIFDNPTLAFYKSLHDTYGAVFLLSLFHAKGYNIAYKTDTWNIAATTDRFKDEFAANSSWLKMGFHGWGGNVRYREGFTGTTVNYDYSRDFFADNTATKTEVLRFAGAASWYSEFVIPHFYDMRKTEALAMRDGGDMKGLLGIGLQQKFSQQSSYLTKDEIKVLTRYGFVSESNILHAIRQFAFERTRGTLKVDGSPYTVVEYLENFNHPSIGFLNPETHESQISGDNGINTINTFSAKHDMLDYCSWCKSRGYGWKFPRIDDFEIFNSEVNWL